MSSQTTPSPATLSVGKTTSADPRPYTAPGKRAYVKPELIILDGETGEGTGQTGTPSNKGFSQKESTTAGSASAAKGPS